MANRVGFRVYQLNSKNKYYQLHIDYYLNCDKFANELDIDIDLFINKMKEFNAITYLNQVLFQYGEDLEKAIEWINSLLLMQELRGKSEEGSVIV